MKSLRCLTLTALLVATLAGCGGETYIGDRAGHSLTLRDDVLTAHADGHPDAVVDATGTLTIDGKPVPVTPAQRALLKAWHDQLVGVRTAGIRTGVAGVKLAGHAVADAVTGGGKDASARAEPAREQLRAEALAICDHFDALQKTQNALAASLPAFKSYAALEVRADADCRANASRHPD